MDVAEFERLLRIGLGRAILFLREHDAAPYRDVILQACLRNTALDRQIEGSRATYMHDLICLTDESDFYRNRILDALPAATDGHDVAQLFDFARIFAEQGDTRARSLLYETAAHNIADLERSEYEAGLDSIVDLDGAAGLLFLAEHIGGRVLADPEEWADERLREQVEERDGREATQAALRQAAAENPHVAAYVDATDAILAEHKSGGERRVSDMPQTYEALWRLIAERGAKTPRSWLIKFGRQATSEEIQRAAADLLAERDPGRLLALLRIFRRRRFPLAPERLLALAHDRDRAMAEAALAALANVDHPAVRRLALDLFAAGQRLPEAVDLLRSNYQPGDYTLIEQAAAATDDLEESYSLMHCAFDVIEAHPTPDAASALLQLYERGPCSYCREQCIDLLRQFGRLPDWMLQECLHDSSDDIRQKARQYLAAQGA